MNVELDLITVGEAMAMLVPDPLGALADASHLRIDVAGAESNVALHAAALGLRVAWLGRVGNDPFGARVVTRLREGGVDVESVEIDDAAPTGVFFKDPASAGTRVHYYRGGSAASLMNAEFADRVVERSARALHISGITPALSADCAALVSRLTVCARELGMLVSFDVNYRAGLWGVEAAAPLLLDLAAGADVVFVGLDEAGALWGVSDASAVRRLLPSVPALIVKDGAAGATEYRRDKMVFAPSRVVEVIEPVGAGDAFAAGYLSAILQGLQGAEALDHGHSRAAASLSSPLDVPETTP